MCPTLIVLMVGYYGRPYRTKTLLDSGSDTNWIALGVLNNIRHTVIGKDNLLVQTVTGKVKRRYALLEVYYKNENEFTQALKC